MRRKPLITLILIAYAGLWAATATLGVSKAWTAAGGGVDLSSWNASSPAPFWIVENHVTWNNGGGTGVQSHFVWVPGLALEVHTRDTGWAGCRYPIF